MFYSDKFYSSDISVNILLRSNLKAMVEVLTAVINNQQESQITRDRINKASFNDDNEAKGFFL